VHRDRHRDREQGEPEDPVGGPDRCGRLPASGSLRYSHRASSTCTAARPSTTEASSDFSVIAASPVFPNRLKV
jgi:hypothetical protein